MKAHKQQSSYTPPPTPPLRLVTGENSPKKKRGHKFLLQCLFIFFGVTVYLVYAALNRSPNEPRSMDTFSQLDQILRKEGVARFKEEKLALKQLVRKTLEEPASAEEHDQAKTIAVYLFPEILANNDFERELAEDLWGSLQKGIENEPGSPQSRALFNELRANIWNYENADRTNPQLSLPAKQVIRLYETLSAP
jgi:hypothetical protein